MAIFGAGSNWDGVEMREQFFRERRFVIGWNQETGSDYSHLWQA